MARRKIYKLPKYEKMLRKKSAPVKRVTREVKALIQDLRDTLDSVDGIGLAAPQIGVLQRVCLVMLGSDNEDENAEPQIIALIDPEIVSRSEEVERGADGCLSIPGLQGYTRRHLTMTVRALNEEGQRVEYNFTGYDARIAQHEIDHLDGILYFDRLDTLDDLYYLVPDEEKEEGIKFVPYLDIHPELKFAPETRQGIPTTGITTIAG